MKKFRFLAVALVALAFASCSKDKGVNDPNGVGEPALLNLSFVDNATSKVAGDAVDVDDKKVNEYLVYAFDGGGNLITVPNGDGIPTTFPQYFEIPNGIPTVQTLKVTTAAKSVFVVANGGTHNGDLLGSPANHAELLAVTADMDIDQAFFAKGDVLMTGKDAGIEFTTSGSLQSANVAVKLKFPVAKLKVTVKDSRKNNVGDNLLSEPKISVLYVGKLINIFDAADGGAAQNAHPTGKFYSGMITYIGITNGAAALPASGSADNNLYYTDAEAIGTNPGVDAVDYHYYVPANDGVTQPTIISLKNSKKSGGFRYYPIRFKKGGTMTSTTTDKGPLVVGKSYNVAINLSGDISNGEGYGVDGPETDTPVADIVVTITPADWGTPVSVGVDFE